MTLTYWIADALTDHACYSIRARTRHECVTRRDVDGASNYGKPRKIVIVYKDAFDLMRKLLAEGGAEHGA